MSVLYRFLFRNQSLRIPPKASCTSGCDLIVANQRLLQYSSPPVKFSRKFYCYGEAFLRLFYPSLCVSCVQLLELDEKGLCRDCLKTLKKLRLEPAEEKIRTKLAGADEGWSLFRYEGLVKDILHQIKFKKRRDLVKIFDREIRGFLKRHTQLASYDCILPIPMDRRRYLEREFNQSGLLAQTVYGFLKSPRLKSRILARKGGALPQSLLGRQGRRINVDHVFSIRNAEQIQGRSLLLVDDIFTTGATIGEISKIFKSEGVSRVGYLTLARTLAN